MASTSSTSPNCLKCRHFYVTYEPKWPRGCRVFGFKGKQLPSITVKQCTGSECPAFQARINPEPRSPADGKNNWLA